MLPRNQMKTISIPTNDRPDYLRRVLSSISRADRCEDWVIAFSCEPNVEVRKFITSLSIPYYASFNSTRRGCWVNTFLAVDFAMSIGSDFNLYLEDDVVISPDALVLCDEFARQLNHKDVLVLRRPHDAQTDQIDRVTPVISGLFGDGFAFSREMWPAIRAGWFSDKMAMWDWSVQEYLISRSLEIVQWRPCVNRSQNIGVQGTHTTHGTDPNHFSPCYSGTPVKEFRFEP